MHYSILSRLINIIVIQAEKNKVDSVNEILF